MARDGSGTHSLPQAAFVSGTTIESAKVNSNFSDISAALTASLAKDGQTVPTANLPMGGFKHTGVADGSSRTDYASLGQVAKGTLFYAADTGAADVYAVAPSPGIAANVVGFSVDWKVTNANLTTTPTLAANSLTAGTIVWPNGTALAAGDLPAGALVTTKIASLSGSTPTWHLMTVAVPSQRKFTGGTFGQSVVSNASGLAIFGAAPSGVRQTVAAGPVVTATGLPDFLPATDADLNLVSQNISASAPFVATAASGWSSTTAGPLDTVGVSTANLTWTGLTASRAAATPNFLYATISGGVLTTGFTLVAPVYQWGGTPAVTSGLFTFNISEMKGYLGNGSTAPQTNLVMVGEAATDGTGVISTVAYAYNGRYDSGFTATLPAATVSVSKNHNIGVKPFNAHFIIENTTTEAGYAVGDQVIDPGCDNGSYTYQAGPRMTAKTIARTSGSANSGTNIINASTGASAVLTVGNWKYKFTADRGW